MVLGKSIQESQCITIAKFVLINLNLIAEVNQRGFLQVIQDFRHHNLTLCVMKLILEIVLRGRNAIQDFYHSLKVELSHKLFFCCHFSEIV